MTGNLQSYDYPNYYPPNVNCTYRVTPLPDNCMLQMRFDEFDFDYSPECTRDYLEINGVRVKSGLLIISNGMSFRWTADRHGRCGNLGMADGSVQSASNSGLSAYASNSTPLGMAADLRLAIP